METNGRSLYEGAFVHRHGLIAFAAKAGFCLQEEDLQVCRRLVEVGRQLRRHYGSTPYHVAAIHNFGRDESWYGFDWVNGLWATVSPSPSQEDLDIGDRLGQEAFRREHKLCLYEASVAVAVAKKQYKRARSLLLRPSRSKAIPYNVRAAYQAVLPQKKAVLST